MSEHLSRAAAGEEVVAWCRTCARQTRHRADRHAIGSNACRPGPCLEHGPKVDANGLSKAQAKRREQQQRQAQQPDLFAERTP